MKEYVVSSISVPNEKRYLYLIRNKFPEYQFKLTGNRLRILVLQSDQEVNRRELEKINYYSMGIRDTYNDLDCKKIDL